MSESYQCAECGGVFDKVQNEEWNDEVAKKEFEIEFPEHEIDETCIVCEDCYKQLLERAIQ